MGFYKPVGGIKVDGIPFLYHVPFYLCKVIKRFVVGDELFQAFVGVISLQFTQLCKVKGPNDLIDFGDSALKCL